MTEHLLHLPRGPPPRMNPNLGNDPVPVRQIAPLKRGLRSFSRPLRYCPGGAVYARVASCPTGGIRETSQQAGNLFGNSPDTAQFTGGRDRFAAMV